MTNNNLFGIVRNLFGKTLALAFLFGVMAVASYAQSANLYEARGRARLGTITAYPSTGVWRIDMGNTNEIKIYSCRANLPGGISCVFTQFSRGRVVYSGYAQIYQSGAVNLRWMYDFTAGFQRTINGGWVPYQVR